MADLQDRMKQAVAEAVVQQIRDGMVVGLGSGSTAALMIQGLGAKLKSGELRDIVGVTTSFQGEVLAAELGTVSETFSRTLAKFRQQKLLSVRGKTIVVMSPARLKKLLQQNLGE